MDNYRKAKLEPPNEADFSGMHEFRKIIDSMADAEEDADFDSVFTEQEYPNLYKVLKHVGKKNDDSISWTGIMRMVREELLEGWFRVVSGHEILMTSLGCEACIESTKIESKSENHG
ncbi:hypothetical protein LAG90_15805 [Marinilongibacter aquaticus]|uniref:hypothetical protein n=1 Tax=Marinilongibacter aquaticus TaxID=2975157 RepID=UPI0021BD8BAA|nr:hypothetical protein [Marinilongibacter aquaticus]UBM58269.1 hypothetical protein LAG90_15805 [Marinilongibacter aquaticus]